MKILVVFILTVLVYLSSFAQKRNSEDPIYGGSSKTKNEKIKNFDIQTDEFTKAKVITQVQGLLLFQKGFSSVYCGLKKVNDQIGCEFVFSNESYDVICVNSDSKVMLKLKNEDIITLKHIGKIECEKSITVYTMLSEEDIKSLSENQVEKIRFYSTEGYMDFELFELIPKNYMNKKFFGNYIEKNPKQEFSNLINEIKNL